MPSLERPAIINTVIGVSPYDLGKAIGGWNSQEQALVLQGLSDRLRDFGSLGASHQVSNIIQELDGRADYLLELLAEYAGDRAAAQTIPSDAPVPDGAPVPCPLGCGWDHANHVPLGKTPHTAEEAGK